MDGGGCLDTLEEKENDLNPLFERLSSTEGNWLMMGIYDARIPYHQIRLSIENIGYHMFGICI